MKDKVAHLNEKLVPLEKDAEHLRYPEHLIHEKIRKMKYERDKIRRIINDHEFVNYHDDLKRKVFKKFDGLRHIDWTRLMFAMLMEETAKKLNERNIDMKIINERIDERIEQLIAPIKTWSEYMNGLNQG